MVSTPNAPDGLFEHIEKEDEENLAVQKDYYWIILMALVRYTPKGD